jgi:CIC family chloride channel protein
LSAPLNRAKASFWDRVRAYILGDYLRKWAVLGVLIGAVAGTGAIVFYLAIQKATWLFLGQLAGYEPPLPRGEGDTLVHEIARPWAIPLVTALGGLISGVIVFSLAPEAEGHGTDAAIEAFHERGGRIRSRIPLVKLVASAVTIGSGGSAGREGPTAQIAAGFGSWLGEVFQLSAADRRTALAVGVGSGIGAIFKAPLGGAILSAEILYVRDFELDALVPGFIASVVGYSIFGAWAGWDPVFGSGLGLSFNQPDSLVWYSLLGLACGLVGIAYVRLFYGTRDLFRALPMPDHVKPALGGLAVGLIALAYPEVLSMGYGWLQFALEGDRAALALKTIVALVALKILATSLTIGSGGSGGVFAPGLFIGGMVGGSIWGLAHTHVPWMPDSPAPFVIVGMMALFGGVAKAPIAVILMVAEMTNEFSMIIPAMLATTIAYLISGDVRIYRSQVETRAQSPAHRGEFVVPLIQLVTVGDAMRTDFVSLSPGMKVEEAAGEMQVKGRKGFPVTDGGRLVGIFTATDAVRAEREGLRTVGEAMTTDLRVAFPGDTVHVALRKMTEARVSRLPVVHRDDPQRIIGMIDPADIALALDRQLLRLPDGNAGQAGTGFPLLNRE